MQTKRFLINHQIRANELRVIGSDGAQVGVLKLSEALKKAESEEMDLVLISENATPPVAKITELKRFLYEQEQKEKKLKKSKAIETKEIRVGPFISGHDLQTKINQGKKFLADGDNFKLTVHFKPRQMRHTEFGTKIFDKVCEMLGDLGKVEREPKWEGRRYTAIFSKGGHKTNAKSEN